MMIIRIMFFVAFLGQSTLREVFLKVDNNMEGQYFAEMIKVYKNRFIKTD